MNTIKYEAFSGQIVDLFAPKIDTIDENDVVLNLSRTARYGGGTDDKRFAYSVAEHSCHLYDYAKSVGMSEETSALALIHDAPEYLMSDVITPIKTFMFIVQPGGQHVFKFGELEDVVFSAISRKIFPKSKIGLNEDNSVSSTKWAPVHEIDSRIVADEWTQLKLNTPMPAKLLDRVPLGVNVECWDEVVARREFRRRLEEAKSRLS